MLQRSPAMDGPPCAGTGDSVDGLAVAAEAFLPQVLSMIAMLAAAMAVGCGAVLALRRLAGAIAAQPGPEAVLAVCGAGLLLVATGDLAMRSSAVRPVRPSVSWLPSMLARLGLLIAVAAMCLPLRMTSPGDALTTVAVLIVSLVAVIRGPIAVLMRDRLLQRRPAAGGHEPVPATAAVPLSAAMRTAGASRLVPQAPFADGAIVTPPSGSLLQRFERLALPDGGECVRGRLCVVVPVGSRTGYAHVGFCPPLASHPTVDVTTDYDGVEAVVSAAEVLPWGARIECRLDEPAEETVEIPVDILAKSLA